MRKSIIIWISFDIALATAEHSSHTDDGSHSLPTATSTSTPQPTSTPSPTPTPTATYPPYVGTPFIITFIRDGNLWLSEVGGSGERRLTNEPVDWPVTEYAISPTCDRIAYIPYKGPPTPNALIKQVLLSDGSISVSTGENDALIEYGIGWLDNDHITLVLSEFTVPGFEKDPSVWQGLEPFHHIVFDLGTGKRTFIPESLQFSQSPNGRYWLTCSRYYVYEGACNYMLRDLITDEQWPVAEGIGWGGFLGWAPDSSQMLFSAFDDPPDRTTQLVIIDTVTHIEQSITPSDKTVMSGSWAPDGQTIAFAQCDVDDPLYRSNCALWLIDNDGKNARRIPVDIPFDTSGDLIDLTWTPDGSRLIFSANYDPPVIWSVKTDGTDLRPIASNASPPQVLCKP